jgi:succinate dehydrogenase/fumarate reductase flavoprotein subunit
VIDVAILTMNGEVIPGLYCGGESAGGFSQHGLARAACQGYIAGRAAAAPLLEQGILNAPISRILSSGAGRVSAMP